MVLLHDNSVSRLVLTGVVSILALGPRPSVAEAPITGTCANGRLPGFTAPLHRISLDAIRAGRLSSILAEEGDVVSPGDVLVELADEALQARIYKARLAAESTVATRLAEFEYKSAQREFERFQKLQQSSSVTNKEVEDARDAAESARLRLEEARFEHSLARAEYEVQLGLREQLMYRSPIQAYIVKRLAEVGEVVEPGDKLLEIAQLDVLAVEVDCPLHLLSRIRPGLEIPVRPAGDTLAPRTGRVTFVSKVADAASQTARVVVHVKNGDSTWLAGMRVDVDMRGAHHDQPADDMRRVGDRGNDEGVKGFDAPEQTIGQ